VNAVGTGLNQVNLTYGIVNQAATPIVSVPMTQLKMLRPFTNNTGNPQTENYAIEGRECNPVSASCKWRLTREIGKLVTALETGGWNTQLGAPNGLQNNLPILCRMIRVTPKLTQISQLCDPERDLFLSPYSNALGVASDEFEEMEMMTFPINRRRYTVISDSKFKIQNGLTVSYQRSIKSSSGSGVSSTAMLQPVISNTNANCEKYFTTGHTLTQKKGKPVFYDQPDLDDPAVDTATAGQTKEYILYHFMYMGGETYLDNEGVTQKAPIDLRVSAIPTVKFTDV
jgi:hypothetical protein